MTSLENFMAHHGIKGMKWGVRKDRSPGPAPGTTQTVQLRPGGKVTTRGGHDLPASADALRAHAARTVAKKSGTSALSNKELQDLVTRMNLEQQYSRLATSHQVIPGAKFAKEVLLNVGKQQATKLAMNAVTKAVGSAL